MALLRRRRRRTTRTIVVVVSLIAAGSVVIRNSRIISVAMKSDFNWNVWTIRRALWDLCAIFLFSLLHIPFALHPLLGYWYAEFFREVNMMNTNSFFLFVLHHFNFYCCRNCEELRLMVFCFLVRITSMLFMIKRWVENYGIKDMNSWIFLFPWEITKYSIWHRVGTKIGIRCQGAKRRVRLMRWRVSPEEWFSFWEHSIVHFVLMTANTAERS